MKRIIFLLFISTTVFAQTPRLKFRQIQKDTTQGSIAISNPADSQLVFSRDFYISYGVDTVLILYGDTLGGVGGGFASILSDGVTVLGDGTTGNELKVDTATVISTIQGLVDSLSNYVTLSGTQAITGAKTFTNTFTQSGGDANFDSGTLFVDESANRVGIGTSSPQYFFDVNSYFNVDNTTFKTYVPKSTFPGLNTSYQSTSSTNFPIFGNSVAKIVADTLASYGSNRVGTTYLFYAHTGTAIRTIASYGLRTGSNFSEADREGVLYFGTSDGTLTYPTEKMRIQANGNVGIGTTSPSYKLDVNGNVRADTYYYDVTSTLQSSSDSRLKQNITDMDNVLDKLKELELVKYEWNDNMYKKLEGRTSQSKLGGTFEGMIAQQVESLFPQYVGEDADGYKTLSYVSFVIPLLKGFQEQQSIIESQATKIEQLKTLITDLSNRLQILENN